jgi:hypothetical protein
LRFVESQLRGVQLFAEGGHIRSVGRDLLLELFRPCPEVVDRRSGGRASAHHREGESGDDSSTCSTKAEARHESPHGGRSGGLDCYNDKSS